MKESDIIKRCIKQDKKAWNLFIEKYSRLIYWAIRKRLTISGFHHNEADIEDIFQEVLLSILKGNRLLQLKNPKYLASWLAITASNKTVDYMRQKISSQQDLIVEMPEFSDHALTHDLLERDAINVIKEVVNALSDKERIAISLNILENRTHKEIAQITKIPINTVSTMIARAKEKVKKGLKRKDLKNK
jgi:RNA polymerase sigma-70 factor (ECF subfamily)